MAAPNRCRVGGPEPVRLVHGRALHPCRLGPPGRTVPQPALPAFQLHDAMHGLAVDQDPLLESQPGPHPPVAEGLLAVEDRADPLGQGLVARVLPRWGASRAMLPVVETRPRDAQRPTQEAERDALSRSISARGGGSARRVFSQRILQGELAHLALQLPHLADPARVRAVLGGS